MYKLIEINEVRCIKQKIVFFDLDGTILTDENTILESTKQAIKTLQDEGIYVAIATGRSPKMFSWILEELNIKSYVSLNGQHVVFEGKEIYTDPIKKDVLSRLTTFATEKEHSLTFCGTSDMVIRRRNDERARTCYEDLNM